MAIPTQFSVTSTRTSPIANPSAPQDIPQSLDAENVSIVDGAEVLSSLSSVAVDTPNALTSESGVSIPLPAELTAKVQAAIDNAVTIPAEAQAGIDAPSAATVQPSATITTPTAATSQAEAAIAAPSTLTTVTGTLTTPPFPLNHARILSSNKLQAFTSVSSDAGGVAENALKPNTWEKWRPSGTGFFKVVLGSQQEIDTICIGSHNFGTRGFTISPQYRETAAGPLIQFAGARTPSDDKPLMFHRSSSIDAEVIEIYISGPNVNGEAGYISAGLALQMQRPFFNGHTPITDADATQYYSNRTESGEIIGQQIRRQGYETSADWQNIDDTWYRIYFAPFKQAIKTKPFFFAWNLLEYPEDIGFCRISQDISAPMQNGTVTKRSISMNLLGAG